jgi:hypothetical protein
MKAMVILINVVSSRASGPSLNLGGLHRKIKGFRFFGLKKGADSSIADPAPPDAK